MDKNNVANKSLMIVVSVLLAFVLYFVKETSARVEHLSNDMTIMKVDIGRIETRLNMEK